MPASFSVDCTTSILGTGWRHEETDSKPDQVAIGLAYGRGSDAASYYSVLAERGGASMEDIKVLARREWERLKATLELNCQDFVAKKGSNQIELIAPGKKMTFTFESAAKSLGDEPCTLDVTTPKDVTQYLFRLSEDNATGHFFERQRLMNLPNHLIHGLPKTTIEKIGADAFRYLSR